MVSGSGLNTLPGGRRFRYRTLKRVLDVIFSALGIVLLAPGLVAVALTIWAVDGRPIFFFQQRVGLGGKSFTLAKFRSMKIDTLDVDADDFARVTSVGRLLRLLSLDELPSLVNILRGDMSFVGPRPLLLSYLAVYSSSHLRRHDVRPGLTGLAQVSGRNHLSWRDRLDLDVVYIESYSFRLDLSVLLRTLLVLMRPRGINQSDRAIMDRLQDGYDRV